ncbi:hypothetical protein [Streptomyces sp. NPDC057877]|uniref:hypothetical protein n=1 Tax=Streptomyces sp. NPDC057877 TaxID=3346269 RepID=UPI003679BB76
MTTPRALSPTVLWRRLLHPWSTRRLLETHLLVLLVCSAVAAVSLLASYRQTERAAESLAARHAPTAQGLAATRLAVLRADREVEELVDRGLVDVAGSGETYRAQLSAADQGLSWIGDRTDQDLSTVNGLLTSYGNSITSAMTRYHDQSLMQEHKRAEARSLLTRARVGLVARLDQLQRNQSEQATATATMSGWQRAGWWIAELSLAVLALTLVSALFVLRDRCGRDWDPYLLAALLLTALFAVVPALAVSSAQHHLDEVRADLDAITALSQQRHDGSELADTQETLTEESERVRQKLADGTWADPVYQGSLTGGLLIVVLPAVGLGRRLEKDYWGRT